jgi:hypothetical protein
MTDDPKDLDAFIQASARAVELPLDPEWKAAVRDNLKVIFAHATTVSEFPLPDEAEPAPVFKA